MKTFPLYGDDAKPDSPINKIISNGLGKIIILEEAATTANAIVPHGEIGYFNNKLYFSIGGNTYRADLTLV